MVSALLPDAALRRDLVDPARPKSATFPARPLVQFFRNHALLSASGQHQWWTVQGGSVEYVPPAGTASARARRGSSHPHAGAARHAARHGVSTVHTAGRAAEPFRSGHLCLPFGSGPAPSGSADHRQERAALSAIRFQDNQVILHRDTSADATAQGGLVSWVYKADTTRPEPAVGVTYWMNRLQNIPESDPLFVTLNPSRPVPDASDL